MNIIGSDVRDIHFNWIQISKEKRNLIVFEWDVSFCNIWNLKVEPWFLPWFSVLIYLCDVCSLRYNSQSMKHSHCGFCILSLIFHYLTKQSISMTVQGNRRINWKYTFQFCASEIESDVYVCMSKVFCRFAIIKHRFDWTHLFN